MDGEDLYNSEITNEGIIILGNEANGISKEIEELVTKRITIPRFGNLQQTESLNVATATAIVLSEFKRRVY
jgi:TrmH family RNA methyltransferase